MDWVVVLLLAVIIMLWWIRAAIEPIREYFLARIAEAEAIADERADAAREERADYAHFLAGSTPERAQAMMDLHRRMDPDGPKSLWPSRNGGSAAEKPSSDKVVE